MRRLATFFTPSNAPLCGCYDDDDDDDDEVGYKQNLRILVVVTSSRHEDDVFLFYRFTIIGKLAQRKSAP